MVCKVNRLYYFLVTLAALVLGVPLLLLIFTIKSDAMALIALLLWTIVFPFGHLFATVLRLRDAGHNPWWLLLFVPFGVYGLVVIYCLFTPGTRSTRAEDVAPVLDSLVAASFGNQPIYVYKNGDQRDHFIQRLFPEM